MTESHPKSRRQPMTHLMNTFPSVGRSPTRATETWLRLGVLLFLGCAANGVDGAPIALHPDNPHYFLWQDRAVALISSGEHYGAVLNLDFDYRRYIETLAADGMMLTRTFSGTYAEPEGAFNIAGNSLAPPQGRFVAPWARSDQPGDARGGNKFDLTQWDENYFKRLHDYFTHAAEKGIIVEFTLFCPMYEDKQWALSPMNTRNNINGVGAIGRNEVHTLDRNNGLLPFQEALVRKLVTELNRYDNVMFEICNEPYFGGVTLAWQHHIADVIVDTERILPKKHLITQNIANQQAKIAKPHPAVSVFNFHYATPPNTVAMNYQLNKVIGDNETGFRGTNNAPYRTEGWEFILAGGALYNNLDYSFVAGHEDGTFVYPTNQPGGGNAQLRRELRALREFIHEFDLAQLKPDNSVLRGGVPPGVSARALVQPGKAIAAYFRRDGPTNIVTGSKSSSAITAALQIDLPKGHWRAEWIDPRDGSVVRTGAADGPGVGTFELPAFQDDVALRLQRTSTEK